MTNRTLARTGNLCDLKNCFNSSCNMGVSYLPLDSYRLAKYAEQVPCYICELGNTCDAEMCRYCQAPMALTHQADSQGVKPRMIAVAGAAGAGKTVYLGMLTDILSRFGDDLRMEARGAFSISLQQQTIQSLNHCRFPGKTPNEPDRWKWVHSRVLAAKQKQPVELIMPDLAGDALGEEIDHPHSFPVIRAFLTKCSGLVALIDCERLMEGDESQDFFAMKLVAYLNELDEDPKTNWQKRPISWVFTKADRCDQCFDDPMGFARKHLPGLSKLCREHLKRTSFFAASVAGATARETTSDGAVQIPLRVEPRGVVEPFRWLVQQLASVKPGGWRK